MVVLTYSSGSESCSSGSESSTTARPYLAVTFHFSFGGMNPTHVSVGDGNFSLINTVEQITHE